MVSDVGSSRSQTGQAQTRALDAPAAWQHTALRDERLTKLLLGIAVVIAVALLAIPMLQAGPAPLTSDESLYLAEGYTITQGAGPAYPSGELVHHRAPLFPALLAIPIRAAGGDPDAAYIVPKLVALALIAATFLVARQAFGTTAGVLAALLVASSSFLRWLGTSLFLDGTETLFLLLTLAALMRAFRDQSSMWFAAAGLLSGAAFLTKEAALLWLPLPMVFALLSEEHRTERVARGILAYLTFAGALLAFWWLWVYLATERIYLWGKPDAVLLALATGPCAAVAAGAIAWRRTQQRAPARLPSLARWYGIGLLAAWAAGAFVMLEISAAWPFPRDFITNVPSYVWEIAAPNTQPWPLVGAGVAWLCWRAARDANARLLAVAFAMFLPFALHVANRSLSYRDVLPLVYVAYIAAGGLGAMLLARISTQQTQLVAAGAVAAGLVVFGWLQTQELTEERLPYDRTAVTQANWGNPMAQDAAAWVHENLPRGSRIMSSRLYYSHLYVLDEAVHPVYQLPTVRVDVRAGETPLLAPASTLFRWEDDRLDEAASDGNCLYVRRYPTKGYYIALSEDTLLRDLRERAIDFLVLTGEDAGFSSLTYLDYFETNPAFSAVYADVKDERNAVFIYRVDREELTPIAYQAVVSEYTLDSLVAATGLPREDLARAIDADGIVVRP